jgi:hypothetical protein
MMTTETMTETEQAFAEGYRKAQNDAALLFGMSNYETANKDMMQKATRIETEPDYRDYCMAEMARRRR